MNEKRKHERYELNGLEVNGTVIYTNAVNVIDISIEGISLETNKLLNIGGAYALKLKSGNKAVYLRGTVVWSSLSGSRNYPGKDILPVYKVGLYFKDMPSEKKTELLGFIEANKKEIVLMKGGRRLNVRFHINDIEKAFLNLSSSYHVKKISLGGMLISSVYQIDIDSRIPMELSLGDDDSIKFLGRVASCQLIESTHENRYDLGIEFIDLTDEDKKSITRFVDFNAASENAPLADAEKVSAGKGKIGLDLWDKGQRSQARFPYNEYVMVNDSMRFVAVDLSEGGIFLFTGRPFRPGSILKLDLPIMNQVLKVKARVQFSKRDVGAGLQFVELDEQQRLLIKKAIETVLASNISGETTKQKVLFVMNSQYPETSMNMFISGLISGGYSVLDVQGQSEAIPQLEKRYPLGAIILVIESVDDPNFNLLSHIKKISEYSAVPVLVISQSSNSNFKQLILDAGATKCLPKISTSPNKLLEILRSYP